MRHYRGVSYLFSQRIECQYFASKKNNINSFKTFKLIFCMVIINWFKLENNHIEILKLKCSDKTKI